MVDNMRLPDDEGDWDDIPSKMAEAKVNRIWETKLSDLYQGAGEGIARMCEMIVETTYLRWVEEREEATIGEDADQWVKARKEDALLEGVNEHKEQ